MTYKQKTEVLNILGAYLSQVISMSTTYRGRLFKPEFAPTYDILGMQLRVADPACYGPPCTQCRPSCQPPCNIDSYRTKPIYKL